MLALVILLLLAVHIAEAHNAVLHLKHGFAHLEGSSVKQGGRGMSRGHFQRLIDHDRARMQRRLAVVDFPLSGNDDPLVTGLYYTQVGLGTPMQSFYLQVDTGSDLLWVNCAPCNNCPSSSGLNIPLSIYNPTGSSSSEILQCSNSLCLEALQKPDCDSMNRCSYQSVYGDGSATSGYLVSDAITYNQLDGTSDSATISSANIVFGCGYNQTGDLLQPTRAVDGLMGFGQDAISVPSQLAAQGLTPNVFAHCLEGENKGSGILVIGEVMEPDVLYTPIVPGQQHYNVELQNIAVNNINVSQPSVFAIPNYGGGGVIFDCGTTLAYIVQPAYGDFVDAVVRNALVEANTLQGQTCFSYSGSLDGVFPGVTLYFAGGAMELSPDQYMIQQEVGFYCIGWFESTTSPGYPAYSILGDIVLKDKLVVYDNERGQIGWKSYDCTQGISVSSEREGNSSLLTVNPYQTSAPGVHSASSRPLSISLFLSILACAFSNMLNFIVCRLDYPPY
ncbi:unnamed protein product [Sphagnum jensenii]|uniref:Peptidase A1 domain-containing protein n=1 Tax=Sphagnum jensenii TaxID=128206 RepID=A0ABP0X461_9BRYO